MTAFTSTATRMPLVVYVFALSAFALGFTEFVTIGLVSAIAADLKVDVSAIGAAVAAYAIGATIGAPILTALAAPLSRKHLLVAAMLVFTLGNALVGLSADLPSLLAARFGSGLGHGVFLAVASSAATRLVEPERAGSAVAVVFGGLTVALAFGVPIGTWLGGLWTWQAIFMAVAACGAIGLVGLLALMPDGRDGGRARDAIHNLTALLDHRLLGAALITVLAYTGSFCLFSYIAPLLIQVTGMDASWVGAMMLVYGVAAAIGNVAGGRMTDRLGPDRAVLIVLVGLTFILAAMGFAARSTPAMTVLVAALGALTYAAVPALQARVIGLAERRAPAALASAAGLNIAGFNAGIALGSLLGGGVVDAFGLTATAIVGAGAAGVGIAALIIQNGGERPRIRRPDSA
ncbi:MFS transporter [Methylobacterium sp. J-072]|uniref:MFS transporter n=1 Tax=Methylobacterium sp. J-072 TaxID=2836651 RepID=UPI001FBADD67|nr:MFS transporter [Methylobacterium sp. J-072]MCJ2091567.1 MFS transporter [Methylobacterium sp. J-072]